MQTETSTARILREMKERNALAILTANADSDERSEIRIETTQARIEADKPVIYGNSTKSGGTDRITAEKRANTVESTRLTGIPLLEGLALIEDNAGSLLLPPEKISHKVIATLLPSVIPSTVWPFFTAPNITEIARKMNPCTSHAGGRPRKVQVSVDEVRILTVPVAKGTHGSAIHAAFRSTDEEIRSLHGNGRQTPLSDYEALRVVVATRRATRATQRLAAASW